MRLVPRVELISAVAAMILVALFFLVALGGTTRGPGLTLLAAVVGVSLSIGVPLGFLNARRIWSKCMPLGTYRWRTDYWWFPILILVSFVGPALYVVGMQTVLFTADIKRVPSGIPGLDDLIEGGFWPKSTVVILGSSGTGKSTFAVQFLVEGIEQGEQALYVTLEEPPEQIMREADLMGFDLRKFYEKSLFFIHLKGRNFKKMIEEQLPQLVKARADYNIKTRVVIDPMTPVIWATAEKLEQRELIGKLFYTLKELGVVLCTVEEHARPGETIGEDVLLPIYLSDGAIHLEYYPIGGAFNRTLKLLKMRGVHHGEGVYPYLFARGVGIVVRSSPTQIPEEQSRSHVKTFDEAIKTAEAMKAPARVIERIKRMQKHWDYDYSPEEALQILFGSYGLKRGG